MSMDRLRRWRLARLQAGEPGWGDGLDRLPLALAQLDGEGRLLRLSAGWEALTGHDVRQCLGQPLGRYLHPEDQPRWRRCLDRLCSAGQGPACVERFRCLSRGGEVRWVEVRLARHAAGFVAGLADIGEQVQASQSLQAGHRSLSNLLDGLPLMVYRCRNDRLWSMEYVSAGCLALTGYSPEELIDSQCLSFDSLIHPDDREYVWCQVQAGLDQRQSFAFAYRLLCADGSQKPVAERGCGIYSQSGEVLGLEGVILER